MSRPIQHPPLLDHTRHALRESLSRQPSSLPRRSFLAAAASTVAAVALATPAAASARRASAPAAARVSSAFALPGDGVYPEGIAADPRTGDLYVGSYTTGAVYRAAPGRRTADVFLPAGADGRNTANGLKADAAGRLWVTDSTAGVDVYDLRTRALLARFDVPGDAPRFVNDLAIAADGTVFLTDSVREVVHRVTPADLARAVARGGRGELTTAYDLGGVVAPHPAGTFTLNGIVARGRHLFVVDMTAGALHRVDLVDGSLRQVTLHGGDLVNGDGLELVGGTLWAAQNRTDTVSRWRLSADGTSARLERSVTDPALQIPTTLVRHRGRTLVVRSQFDKGGPMGPGTPETPFTVAQVHGI
ncbi:SMP-30/gluconolactonase/LRE family protein [Streptomyces sp. Tue6028]|uniref:SMP-30/gluconolactonase/LRE family protein n=1 Tax=Streptomyces sp. Tue6028 TaxID=2036037 RepID=UPI003EBCF947